MVIHTITAEEKAGCWMITILTVILCVGYYLDSDSIGLMVFGIVPTIMALILLIYPSFLLRRTLIMDEKGCIIRFFGKERYYAWEEFTIKRLEEHWIPVSRGHEKGYVVFFSVYPVEKAQKKNPVDYWRHHPLSMTMFSFHFALSEDEIYEPGYEESYFREKMKEWNVELEEVRMQDWKKK